MRELRITARCLAEDLGLATETPFEDCARVPIVRAFENQRCDGPTGTKTVGPAAGDRTIYRLAMGHRHRGATWFDVAHDVVWLCGYRLHESGDAEDAFPYFHELIEGRRILPTVDDYERLFRDRASRFASTVATDAQSLLAAARTNPGVEQRGLVGGEQHLGAVVEVVETLEETYVAFSLVGLNSTRIIMLLAAFFPDAEFSDWDPVDALPTRPLQTEDAEIGYRILNDRG